MLLGFGFGVKTSVSAPHSPQLRVEQLFVDGLLSVDVVVLQIGPMKIRFEGGEPFSELD